MALRRVPGRYAVARLSSDMGWPWWATRSEHLASVTRTRDETSVVCEEAVVPSDVDAERGFVAFAVSGTIPFSATGVLAGLATPLATSNVSVFSISTYDTDYLLVRFIDVVRATDAWIAAGHAVSAGD